MKTRTVSCNNSSTREKKLEFSLQTFRRHALFSVGKYKCRRCADEIFAYLQETKRGDNFGTINLHTNSFQAFLKWISNDADLLKEEA